MDNGIENVLFAIMKERDNAVDELELRQRRFKQETERNADTSTYSLWEQNAIPELISMIKLKARVSALDDAMLYAKIASGCELED